ncbi:MAG TPA: glutamyl-tRNA reductase [Chthoniobacterales bacterium]
MARHCATLDGNGVGGGVQHRAGYTLGRDNHFGGLTMNLVCVGLSHQTAGVDDRERFAVQPSQLPEAVRRAAAVAGVREAVLLSTCNRVEWYLATESGSGKFDALPVLRAQTGVDADDFENVFQLDLRQSVTHLFRVVCGLESMVLGETEILGQVKRAYAVAAGEGTTSLLMNKLFQRAFSVAKHVRSHTAITRGSVSVGSVAVDLAERIFGRLDHCKVMILGAGDTSERTARALASRGVKSVVVSNRSHDRAVALAESVGGRAIHFEDWEKEFSMLDILISSTAAPHFVVTRGKLEPLMRRRPDRPLFLIDLAVPRDIEPATNDVDGVYLYDIDSLEAIARESLAERQREIVHCEALIDRHVNDFIHWLQNRKRLAETPPFNMNSPGSVPAS